MHVYRSFGNEANTNVISLPYVFTTWNAATGIMYIVNNTKHFIDKYYHREYIK